MRGRKASISSPNPGARASRREDARAEAAGVDVTLSVVDDMQHVFPFSAGNGPEADAEIAAVAAWYRG